MTNPYAGPRSAVASWGGPGGAGNTARGVSGLTGPTDGVFSTEPNVAAYDATRGALIATYAATGYARWLDWISVTCSYSGPVQIFAGSLDDLGRLTSYGDGSLAEFDPNHERYIPQGAPVYVVWTVPDSTHTASCVAGFREVT